MRRTISLLMAALFLLVKAASGEEDRLVILSPHWEGIRSEFGWGFKDRYRARTGRDVKVEWLDVGGGTGTILRFVKSEFSKNPAGIGVDLFFGGGIDPFVELTRLGLTYPYRLPDEQLEQIGKTIGGIPIYDPDCHWYGAALSGFGIIYNRVVLDLIGLPEPKTWEDLGDSRLLTWVGSGDPRGSGAVHMTYEIILQAYGWEKGWEIITGLGANVRNFVAGSSQTPKDVAVGEVAYGMSIDFYAWAQANEAGSDKIGYVMPEDLTVVNPDAIAILRGAPNLKVAEAFVDFVMSEEGQKLWLLRIGNPEGPKKFQLDRFSVMPNLYDKVLGNTNISVNPFRWRSSFRYDSEKGSRRWSVINDLIGVMIIDSHAQLVEAWKKVIEGGMREEAMKGISQAPVSEEEALSLVPGWRNPEIRNRKISAWAQFAREKYLRYGASRMEGGWSMTRIPALGLTVGLLVALVLYMRSTRGKSRA